MSLGSLGSLVVSLTAETAEFTAAMDKAAYKSKASMDAMLAQARAAGPAIGAALVAGAGALMAIVKSAADAQDALNDLSERTGVAVETLAGLQYAAKLSDTSMESLSTAVAKLQKYIGEADMGNNAYRQTLAALGITAKDPEKALIQLADATARLHDPNQRAAVLAGLLGRGYMDLIPLLNQGGDGLREMIARGRELNPVTKESAEQAARFNDSLDALNVAASGAGIQIANALLPALNAAVQAMNDASREVGVMNGALVGLGQLGVVGQTIGVLWANVAYVFKQVGTEIGGIFAQLAALGRGDFRQAGIIGDMMKRDAALARKELDDLERRILGLTGQAGKLAQAAQIKPGAAIVVPKAGAASTKSADPLAALLKSTETAKLKDYYNLLGLLDARYASGKIGANQYAEALLLLNEQLDKAIGTNGAGAAAAAAREAEAMAWAAEEAAQLRDTLNEVNAVNQEWMAAGRDVYEQTRTDAERANREMDRLNALLEKGAIDWDTYARATMDAMAKLGEVTAAPLDPMVEMAKKALQNIHDAMADFLFDPFKNGLDGMLLGFVNVLRRMAAEALANQIFQWMLKSASSSGISWLASAASALTGGARDAGGYIPAGTVGLVGERGPELIHGPASVTSRAQTAELLRGGQRQESRHLNVVIVDDQRRVADFFNSSEGERVIINAARRNSAAFRQLVMA